VKSGTWNVENERIYSALSTQHSTLNAPLTPDSSLAADFLKISVADTGIGIAAEDQVRIFQPFEQVDGSLTRSYEGTGLGLILVKSMAELHGGGVAVESEPGKGSTFTVWLPYAPAGHDADADESDTKSDVEPEVEFDPPVLSQLHASLQQEHVTDARPLALIVDDDFGSAELMHLKLESLGIRSERAATAEGALHWLHAYKADLIVLDVMLPLASGWELLEELKQQHRDDIPVIIASAVAEDYPDKGLSYGVAAMLQKPVDKQALQKALADLGFAA